MIKSLVLASCLGTFGCRETRAITSTEVASVNQNADFAISDAEAERIMQIIRDKLDRGEEFPPNLTQMLQIMINRNGPDRTWQGLKIDAARQKQLDARFQTYLLQYPTTLDKTGFVPGCEGLLFTSLLAASGLPQSVSLAESKDEPGRWYRSADHACYPGQSGNSMSKGIMLGLSLALWQNSDGPSVKAILQYHQKNKGLLGEAANATEQADATMPPSLLSLISEMNFVINGQSTATRGYFPEFGTAPGIAESNFIALRLVLKSALYGGLIEYDFKRIAAAAQLQPQNALFQAVYHGFSDGDGTKAVDILLNETLFPADVLPSSTQRCGGYLWQSDQNSASWKPCDEEKVFSAVDFFWVRALLSNRFRR
jgi:hypothetical protein